MCIFLQEGASVITERTSILFDDIVDYRVHNIEGLMIIVKIILLHCKVASYKLK